MPKIGTRHGPSHQHGGNDEIHLSGLSGQVLFVPYNGKIADIKEADTNKHTLDLATALSENRKILAISCYPSRVSGSGVFMVYPNEGSFGPYGVDGSVFWLVVIKNGTQRLQYAQSIPNTDWDFYCTGYVVEA